MINPHTSEEKGIEIAAICITHSEKVSEKYEPTKGYAKTRSHALPFGFNLPPSLYHCGLLI